MNAGIGRGLGLATGVWVANALAMALMVACNQESPSAASAQPAVTTFSLSAAAANKVEQALVSYENVRALLAKDDLAGIVTDAGNLERAATEATGLSAPEGQGVLKALASGAKQLKEMQKSDADAVRKVFGEVSRNVMTLLIAVPALRSGRFAFHCPMAQGYPKWVQTKAQLENPYMGRRMLACGSASDWSL